MDIITKKQFEDAAALVPKQKDEIEELTEKEFNRLLEEMQNPVKAQQHLAVKIKQSLDRQIKLEVKKNGTLSDHTRRWVESYNKILGDIQKALYGDKSVNLHVHKVSHGDIAAKMRESVIILGKDSKSEEEESDEEISDK